MATKDVTDKMVVKAVAACKIDNARWPYDVLSEWTGQPAKVCYRALERAHRRGLIDYGVSLRAGWLTPAGVELLHK